METGRNGIRIRMNTVIPRGKRPSDPGRKDGSYLVPGFLRLRRKGLMAIFNIPTSWMEP